MKLHLPLSLRTSLLTCMAAVTGLASTVATGSVFAGCVVVAAAMATRASADWAPADITYVNNVSIAATATEALTLTENSVLTYGYAGTFGPVSAAGVNLKLAATGAGDKMVSLNTSTLAANSVWFSKGRFFIQENSVINDAGTLYVQGGQIYLNPRTYSNNISIGSTTYTEDNDDSLAAAIRLSGPVILNGTLTLVEDAAISSDSGSTSTINGAITTNGHSFEKKGAGMLTFSTANTSFDKLLMSGGTLRSQGAANNMAVSVGALDVKASSTLEHNSWNGIWTIGDVTSSVPSAGNTLTLDNSGSHWFRTQFIFNGTSAIDAGSLFDGTIDVKHTGPNNHGVWLVELHAGTETQLSRAIVNLNNYAILAITASQVELEGLTSTTANAYVFSGVNSDTTQMNGTNNGSTPLYTVDGTVRTLTLSGNGNYSYAGTLAGNLIVEKTGNGLQTFGNIGDNVTINLRSGSLSIMGTVGSGTSVLTAAGTSVSIPWELTHEGNLYTATFKKQPDYITGEGTVTVDSIAAAGDTSLSTNDEKYTRLVVGDYAGDSATITSGLVSIVTGHTANPGDIANFGSITTFILDGGGFILPTSANQEFTFDKNIVVQSNGYLRSWGEGSTTSRLKLTGALSGTGTLKKTDGGTITLAGDMSRFTGGIVIGKGTLAFDTDATLQSFNLNNNATLGVIGGHHVSAHSTNAAPWVPNAGTFTIKLENGGDFSTTRIRFTNATTLNLTSDTYGSLTVDGLQCGDMGTTTINVGAHTALNVTGSASTTDHYPFNAGNTFLISHWNSNTVFTINGTLNMLNHGQLAAINPNVGSPTITVNDGGILNLKGLDLLWRTNVAQGNNVIVTLAQGSAMHLGSEGISNAEKLTLTLNGGTLGILDSAAFWSTEKALTLAGDVSVDTRLYTATTDGTAGHYANTNGTITMTGAITGTGTLIKKGAGTLVLASVANLNVQQGFVGTNGTLSIGTLTQMTADGGRFYLDVASGQQVQASTYNGLVNLTIAGGVIGQEYTVFTGASSLTQGNINLDALLDRGLTATTAVSNGVVKVMISGTADTAHNIVWAGEEGEAWANKALDAWTQSGSTTADRFSNGDSVTFSGGGITSISIEGEVRPASMTVSGNADYTFSDGALSCTTTLTKNDGSTLTLDTNTTGTTAAIALNGGEISFKTALGATAVLTVASDTTIRLAGDSADISANLRVAENHHLTLSVADRINVAFGTAVANSATYTKTGAGALQLAAAGTLTGTIEVSAGSLSLAANGTTESAGFVGSITVGNGGKLVSSVAESLGQVDAQRVSSLTLNAGSEWVLDASGNTRVVGNTLTMSGSTISASHTGAILLLARECAITVAGTAASTIGANIQLFDGAANGGTVFNVAKTSNGGAADLTVSGTVAAASGGNNHKGLTKRGTGTMEITGKYTAADICVENGLLAMHDAEFTGGLTVAENAGLTIAADSTFLWDLNDTNRSFTGSLTIEQGATLQTRAVYKYHTTLDANASLSGAGTWVTGLATDSSQHDGFRNLSLNGNTAGFTGVLEMHGTGYITGSTTNAYRTSLYLNSADGAMNGVVRLQGAVYNGGWSVKNDNVVPLMNEIILQKDMTVGGIEGKGGTLKTNVADTARAVLTIGRDDDHVFSGSITDRIDLIKTGSGKQTFNGNLSAFDGTITVNGGTLDMGALAYARDLSLTGANASFATTGGVTVGTDHTLTIGATGTVVAANLNIAGGSLTLGDMTTESHSVGLANHKLTISSTNKTTLSLTLADDLATGAMVDLFTGVGTLFNDTSSLELPADTLLTTYFNVASIPALNGAKLQFTGGKLQIVLARGTGVLLYGQQDNGLWQTNQAFEAAGTLFLEGNNVEFGAIASGDSKTVKLGGGIVAGSITIGAGADKTYSFVQNEPGTTPNSLTSMAGMTVNAGKVEWAAHTLQLTADATISVNSGGTLALHANATNEHVHIALNEGSTLQWAGTNTTDYANENRLSIANNAHVTLDLNNNNVQLAGTVAGAGNFNVINGNLTLGSATVLTGSLSIESGHNLTLTASTDNWALNISGGGNVIVPENGGTARLTGSNTYTGKTQVARAGTLHVTDTSLSAATSGIELATTGSNLQYSATKDTTLDRVISGAGNAIFDGAHTITLGATNTYTGTTTIAAGTTLATTGTSLAAASAIVANGVWSLAAGNTTYTLENAVSGTGGITVSGNDVTWTTATGHEKTYTGTTTIAANTTVTATGPLTTGENSKIVLTDATSTLQLNLTAGMPASWTTGHTVSGAGTLALNGTGQTLSGASLASLIDTSTDAPTLGKLSLTGGMLEITSQNHQNQLKQVQLLEIVTGSQLQICSLGLQDQAGLTLSLAGAGTGDTGTNTAAALYFGNGTTIGTLSRNVSLAADATVYVDTNKTGTIVGSFTGNGHTLTKTGTGSLVFTNASGLDTGSFSVNAGTLQFKADANPTFGKVDLAAGTTLSFYNDANKDNKLTVSELSLAGSATLQTTNHSSTILVGSLAGDNHTLTIDGASSASPTQFVVVQGGTFTGTIDVKQSNTGATRGLVFGATSADTLANAVVKLSQRASTSGNRLLAFAVGGEADGTIRIAGLEGITESTVISTNNFDRTKTTAATLADGNARTLEITGSGTSTFSGSIGGKLTVRMNGSNTQTLAGALADDSHYEVTQGKLVLSGAGQTGSHTFTVNSGTLDMSGYTRSGTSATVVDSVIANGGTVSNLTLGNGMRLEAADSYTGAVALGGTTTLSGGSLVFRLQATETSTGYYGLDTTYAVQTGGSITIGGSADNKTILTFVPVDKRLDPGTNNDGQDYVLITNVGTAFGTAGSLVNLDTLNLGFNMSTSGRTDYQLKVVEKDGRNDLVLNVSGAAATLVWQGTETNTWNKEATNLAWADTDNPGNAASFLEDDHVVFGTLSEAQTITVDAGGVKMGSMLVKGGTDYTFNGGAISSSTGNTKATLTVGGEEDDAFSGTLTLHAANTYAGDTYIHNGTVTANNAGALSDTETHLNGGRLELNFDGTFGASALTMAGGALHAGGNASVSAIALTGAASTKTLSAASGHTLTLTSSSGTIEGALDIGSTTLAAGAAGTVTFAIGTTSLSHAQNVAVHSGTLELAGTTGSYTGSGITLGNGNLKLTGGITATLASLQQADAGTGKVVIDGSTLLFSATADAAPRVEASNAVIGANAGQALTLQDLYLKGAATGLSSATLTGNVTLAGLSQENETAMLTVGTADTSGQATLGTSVTSAGSVSIVNGSLTVKDGDAIGFLESHGALTTLADAAHVSTGKVWLKNGASVDTRITLTINGAATADEDHSWLGDQPGGAASTVGTVIIDHAAAQVHFGAVLTAGQVTIKQGTLTTNHETTVTDGVSLEGANAVLNLMGIDSVDTVTLKQGELQQAGAFAGTLTVDDAGTNTVYATGGLSNAATVDIRHLGEGSSLTGLDGLKLGTATITLTEGMSALFEMNDAATGTVSLADDGRLDVVCSGVLNNILKTGSGRYTVTNGSLGGLINADLSLKGNVVFDPTMNLYNVVAEVDDGAFVFTQLTQDDSTVYISSDEGAEINGENAYGAFEGYTKVNINVNTSIDLTDADRSPAGAADGLVVKNLHSLAEGAPATLTITGTPPVAGTPNDLVTLNNSLSDTWFGGNIDIENADLQIKHSNSTSDGIDPTERELTLRGTLTTDSRVDFKDGKLTLAGNGNVLGGGLSFNDALGEKGLLKIGGNTELGGAIEGSKGTAADMLLTNGSTVSLRNGSTLEAWMKGTGAETLAVGANATATINNGAKIEDVRLNIAENGALTIKSEKFNDLLVNGLSGQGALSGSENAQLGITVHEGLTSVFSGDLKQYSGALSVTGAGTQMLATSAENANIAVNGGKLVLRTGGQIGDDGSDNRSYKDVKVTGGGTLRFDTTAYNAEGLAANNTVTVASLTVNNLTRAATTNTLVFDFNLTADLQTSTPLVQATSAALTNATVQLNIKDVADNFILIPDQEMSFTLMSGITDDSTINPDLVHSSIIEKYFGSSADIQLYNGTLVFTGTTVNGDTARFHADAATTETGRAGADLLDYYFATQNPQSTAPGSLAAGVLGALEGAIAAGDKAQADRIMSGVAGSAVTSLSSAFAAGLDARMTSIRNRMAGMGVDQTLVNEDMPYFHAWISADGANTSLDADSTLAGFKLNSWGGTVGVDIDVNDFLTLGAAFTASYGDLTADGAETTDGHLDTYTAALFAHAQVQRWSHDIVLAVSTANADLDRTVDYGTGNYTAKGATNGFGFGALYEAACNIPVGEEEESVFSPLFRASFTHVSVDAYTETKAESMGLAVGKQDISYATFALGARYVAAVGENVFNRTATLELRAMVLQDAGRRRGEADVALGGSAGRTRTVKGAEPGSTGIQVGASLNVPVEESSAIFADVNLDARSKMTTVNGSVGYRINF